MLEKMGMLKRVDIQAVPQGRSRRRNIMRDVEQFVESGWEAAEIDTSGYKSPKAAQGSWYRSAMYTHLGVTVTLRNGKLFLVRKNCEEA